MSLGRSWTMLALIAMLCGPCVAQEPDSVQATGRAASRPNFLWIFAEDICPDLGCYGDEYARTPNIDRLASEGARFTRAFTVAGVCAPSRSSIITGMYPTTIGTHHMRSAGVPPPYVKCFTEYLRAAGYYCTNNAKTDYNLFANASESPASAWDESSRRAHWRDREPGQPFFATFTIATCHEGQIRANEETYQRHMQRVLPEHRHDPAEAKLPPYYPDTPEVRRDWARYYDLVTAMDAQVGDLLKQLEEDSLADNTIVLFMGDNGRGLPRGKRWLYDSGINVPLIIRLPGGLEAGSVRDELVSLMDLGPTVLSLAGVDPPEHMQGQVVLGDKADPPREYIFAARDRMDETYDIIRAVRDKRFKYIRNFEPHKPYAQPIEYMDQMPTMQVWREYAAAGKLEGPQKLFFAEAKPEEELYDTETDPHEINNLAGDPAHSERLTKLRGVLDQWMKDTNDLGLISEPELLERMRPGGEWAVTGKPIYFSLDSSLRGTRRYHLRNTTRGASIVYTVLPEGEAPNGSNWKLYTEGPAIVPEGHILHAKACRLGYKDSGVVSIHPPIIREPQ